MSITINTSDFIKTKTVTIDDQELEFKPITTAQSLALAGIQERLKNKTSADPTKDLEQILDIYYSLFEPKEKAKEILADLPVDAVASIIKQIGECDA